MKVHYDSKIIKYKLPIPRVHAETQTHMPTLTNPSPLPPQVAASTATSSSTRTSSWATAPPEWCPWPTMARTQTAPSSSSSSTRPAGSMASTWSSARSSREWYVSNSGSCSVNLDNEPYKMSIFVLSQSSKFVVFWNLYKSWEYVFRLFFYLDIYYRLRIISL